MEELGLGVALLRKCEQLHFAAPFSIQAQCVPRILAGENLLGVAETGKGKTVAYVLAVLQDFSAKRWPYYALFLVPSRELAVQIQKLLETFGANLTLRCALLIGGKDFLSQKQKLHEFPDFIVATPARLVEMLASCERVTFFKRLRYAVLDECDALLQEPMRADTNQILRRVSAATRFLLFTATFDLELPALQELLEARSCALVRVPPSSRQIRHFAVRLDSAIPALYVLYSLLLHKQRVFEEGTRGIVFCSSIRTVELLYHALKKLKLSVARLHSLVSQQTRNAAIAQFEMDAQCSLLATDVAARGIDLPGVHWVVNLDFPRDAAAYVHRAGRTGRGCEEGSCVTIFSPAKNKRAATLRRAALEELRAKHNVQLAALPLDVVAVMQDTQPLTKALNYATSIIEAGNFSKRLQQRRAARSQERLRMREAQRAAAQAPPGSGNIPAN